MNAPFASSGERGHREWSPLASALLATPNGQPRCRALSCLFLNSYSPGIGGLGDIDDSIPFSLGGTRNIARPARVIKRKFEAFAASHLFEPDFGIRPIERALNSAQVELYRVAIHVPTLA